MSKSFLKKMFTILPYEKRKTKLIVFPADENDNH